MDIYFQVKFITLLWAPRGTFFWSILSQAKNNSFMPLHQHSFTAKMQKTTFMHIEEQIEGSLAVWLNSDLINQG